MMGDPDPAPLPKAIRQPLPGETQQERERRQGHLDGEEPYDQEAEDWSVLDDPVEYASHLAQQDDEEPPYTVSCPPCREHHGTIEFAPADARHPVCPVCGKEVAR
jgi:hypothetical protein